MTKDLQELISIIRNEVLTEERKIERIQAILGKNPELINAKNRYGWTPLYVASEIGQLEVVKALLAIKGIDVNAANNHGWTPLFLAVCRGYLRAYLENI